MTLGLRMYDMIYDLRIFESIECLSHRYFYFSSREPLGNLLEKLQNTEEFRLLKHYHDRIPRIESICNQLMGYEQHNSIVGQIFVRYMYEKLMSDNKTECVLPLLILFMIDESHTILSGLGFTPKQLYERLHDDLRKWLNIGLKQHWITPHEFSKLMVQNTDALEKLV